VIKPMFTRNGFNIYPAELTRVIAALPGVSAVEVRSIPDLAKENEIEVVVHGSVDDAMVRAWCEAQLSSYKQPGRISIVA